METKTRFTHAIVVKGQIWREGKLLILKRDPGDTLYPGLWDVPGGSLEIGETAEEGLKREAFEEAGLAITKIRPLTTWSYGADDQFEIGISFRATSLTSKITLSNEHTDFAWVTPEEIARYEFPQNLVKEISWLISKGWHL